MSVAQELKERLEDFLKYPIKYTSKLSLDEVGRLQAHFAQDVQEAFHKQFFEPQRKNPKPSMSGLGKCGRQLAYRYHGFKGLPLTPKSKMTFFFGDLIEAAIYVIAEAAGWEIKDIQKFVTVDEIGGHTDGSPALDTVFDVKSMSKAATEIAIREGGISDAFGYLTQLSLYKAGLKAKHSFLLGVNKNTGDIEVWEVPDSPDLVELAKAKYDMVLASTPERLPPRPYTLTQDKKSKKDCLAMQCKFCDFRYLCWNISGVIEGYNKSEVYLVDEENSYGPSPGYAVTPST